MMETDEKPADAGEAFIVKPDADDLCRLCANTDNQLIPIFRGEGLEHNLSFKIETHLPIIKVTEVDKLPLHICYQCASTLISWHNLYEGCRIADKRLREILAVDKLYQDDETFGDYVDDYRDDYGDETHESLPTSTPSTNNLELNTVKNSSTEVTMLGDTRILNETDPLENDERWSNCDSGDDDDDYDYEYYYNDDDDRLTKVAQRSTREKQRRRRRNANIPETSERAALSSKVIDDYNRGAASTIDVCDCVLSSGQCESCVKLARFKCYYCPMVFLKVDQRNRHLRMSHRQELLKNSFELFCKVGRKIGKNGEQRVNEVSNRSASDIRYECDEMTYDCAHCDANFKSKVKIKKHLRLIHDFTASKMPTSLVPRVTKKQEAKLIRELTKKSYKRSEVVTSTMASSNNVSETSSPVGYYICAVCGQIFLKRHSFTRHVNQHSFSRFDCDKCKKTFTTRGALLSHQNLKHKDLPKNMFFLNGRKFLKCDQCSFTCRNERNKMEEHMRVHTGEKPFTCELCGKQFRTRGLLRVHTRYVHEGVKEHACDICGRCFSNKRYMEEHRRIHTGEKPLICDLCGKTFRQNSSLTKHVENHLGIKKHGCQLCGKRFSNSHHLNIHIRRHMGEANYVCDQCGKGFVDQYQLKNHKVVHSEERPFVCVDCGTGFKLLKHLKQHGRTHKTG